MTADRVTYALKVLAIVGLVFYIGQYVVDVLDRIRVVIYILIAAIFFAYLIYPAVNRLARRMPLALAIAIVYAVILGAFAGAAWLIVPRISDETSMLIQRYPDIVQKINAIVNDPNNVFTAHLPAPIRNELSRMPAQLAAWLKIHAFETFGHVIAVLFGTFAVVAMFVVVPMVAAYLLLDLDNLMRGLSSVVPQRRWQATLSLLGDVDRVIGGFIRGQILVALTVGILITIALSIARVPYAFLLGLLAAVGDLIPYVGAVLAYVPAAVSALIAHGLVNALVVTAAFVAIYEAEGHLIAPNIVSKTVKLSPFVVILALLIGAEVGGIVGALVAIPITGVLRVIALRVFHPPEANEAPP